jgi:hypothetical protein
MRGANRAVITAAVVSLWGLTGCGRDSIFFEIHVPDGMAGARVELFLGMHQCTISDLQREDPEPCPGMRPPGSQGINPLPGEVYFRDPGDRTPFETFTDDAGIALLEVGASAGIAHSIVVATPKDDPATAIAAAILDDIELFKGPLKVYVDLVPATKLDQATPGSIGALVWNNKENTRRCVAARNAGMQRGRFVVPDDDHDCDSVPPDKECLPLCTTRSSAR